MLLDENSRSRLLLNPCSSTFFAGCFTHFSNYLKLNLKLQEENRYIFLALVSSEIFKATAIAVYFRFHLRCYREVLEGYLTRSSLRVFQSAVCEFFYLHQVYKKLDIE